ncbi:MAG: HDOD domain-containing protein [Candidatus Latescibacteria bacterium]|nr:HDOD domain-containing protein [Candidatus Latescibacterota bacterium]
MAETLEAPAEEEKPKILVLAQREITDQNFAQVLLEKIGGFRVALARSADDVIHRLQLGPDLILIDPHIEGNFMRAMELLRRMPKLNHVGIAVLSGDQTGVKKCVGKGFNGYILKPYTPELLLSSVWKILDSVPPLPKDGGPASLDIEIDKIEGLPTLPTVYAQVEELCKNPDVDADELAKVIETDPSITMKMLKLSNSAFFGFNREIKSIRDAVALLGNVTVQNAVLSISIFEALKDQDQSAGLDKKEFWKHSASVGSIVRFITNKMKIDREESFTSGILHDIGKVILDGLFAEFYAGVIKTVKEKKQHILQAEELALGLTHNKLGQELAESWGLPPRLIEAISYHHNPKRAELDSELVSLVHIADAIARNLDSGSGGDPYVPCIQKFALEQLAISPEDIIEWEEDILKTLDKDMAFLSAIA